MIRYNRIAAHVGLILTLFLTLLSAIAVSDTLVTMGTFTQDDIDATVEAVKNDAKLTDSTRDDLLVNLAAASSNLATVAQQRQQEKELLQAIQGAPAKSERLKQQLAAAPTQKTLQDLAGKSPNLETISSRISLLEADLKAKTARREQLQQELEVQASRHAIIQARLVELEGKLSDFRLPSLSQETSLADRVMVLVADSRAQAWLAEQKSLKTEVLSLSPLADLRSAEKDWLDQSIDLAIDDLSTLTAAANLARDRETDEKLQSIDALESQVQKQNPLLQQLVDANRDLVQRQQKASYLISQAGSDASWLKAGLESIRSDARLMRSRLDLAARKDELGHVMVRLLTSLPDTIGLRRDVEIRNSQISDVSLSMIDIEEHRKSLRRRDSYLLAQGITVTALDSKERSTLDRLLDQRWQLLDDSKNLGDDLSRLLLDNNIQANSLIHESLKFENYLVGNLLWVRDYSALSLGHLMDQVKLLISPRNWRQLPGHFSQSMQASSWQLPLLLMLLLITLLAYRSRSAFEQMISRPMPLGTMRPSHIFVAVGWALLLVLPGALAIYVAGTILQTAEPRSMFLDALAPAVIFLAPGLYAFLFLRILLDQNGLGRRLLKWNVNTLEACRVEFNWLAPLLLIAGFLNVFATGPSATFGGGPMSSLTTLVAALSILVASVRLLRAGVCNHLPFGNVTLRALSLFSLVIIGMLFLGLLIAADTYLLALGTTFFAVMTIKVIADILERWLLVMRVRLEQSARSEIAVMQSGSGDALEMQDDLENVVSLSIAHAKLITTGRFVATAMALWLIWEPMLPALTLFDSIELWQVMDNASTDGGFRIVSLFDLIIAIVILVLTGLFTRHLPSIVQIVLMEWFDSDSGVRYAVGILTQYVVVGLGVSMALTLIGWDWSSVQWLVAALGVGIGFGLQEIVANFISGLIVLLERPIRVGDTVSVGTTEGTVKKIQSRATVIETFDLKEVMVPNRVLITDEVTNWSLSEQAVRVLVSVGIAYEEDPELAMNLLLEAAQETDLVLCEPEPTATFDDFSENSLMLTLRCYVGESRPAAWTKLRTLIFRKFTDAGISIAFPQRDVHLNISRPVDIQLDQALNST